MNFKLRILYIIISLSVSISGYCQVTNPSVYTAFGIGKLNNSGLIKNQGMGGTGLAQSSDNFINILNPASLTGIDSLNMLIDIGLGIGKANYKTNEGNGNSTYGGLSNISLAFRSSNHTFTGFGLSQYSSIGYNIITSENINGSLDNVSKEYRGDGGIDQVYLSNAILINKNLSLGLKISYLFGQIKKTETFASQVIGGKLAIEYADYIKQFSFEPGFQYQFKVKGNKIRLGATYCPEIQFTTNREVTTSSSSGAGIFEEQRADDYKVPTNVAGGLSISNKMGMTLAFDYRYMNWADITYSSKAASLKDSHRFSGGAEYRNAESRNANPFLWQFGGYVEDSYIRVEGRSIIDAGVNFGVGIPMKNSKSYVNIGINMGRRGATDNSVITENYYGINISLSMVEYWFRKRQFE